MMMATIIAATTPAMAGLASLSALTLALVFVTAAVVKLRAPSATAAGFADLELPFATVLAGAVPAAELVTAAGLVINPRAGAVLALSLLVGFTLVIVRTIRVGLVVSCGCLGSIDRRPVSWDAVVRNTALALMAVMASATTSLHRPGTAALLSVVGVGLVVVLVMQLMALREEIGRIWSVQLAGEPAGQAVGRTVEETVGETGRPDPRRNK